MGHATMSEGTFPPLLCLVDKTCISFVDSCTYMLAGDPIAGWNGFIYVLKGKGEFGKYRSMLIISKIHISIVLVGVVI